MFCDFSLVLAHAGFLDSALRARLDIRVIERLPSNRQTNIGNLFLRIVLHLPLRNPRFLHQARYNCPVIVYQKSAPYRFDFD